MTRTLLRQSAALFVGLTLFVGLSLPAGAVSSVTAKVTVVVPSCTINSGGAIAVNFGDAVYISRINGDAYRQPVNFTLSCSNLGTNDMRLRFTGTPAGFDTNSLATDKSGLGIRLLQAGNPLSVGDWVSFIYPTLPTLEAVPVKDPTATLSGGVFTGTATLMVEYS